MNLNDFLVLPNNKAKCIKLNVRSLQELRTEAVTMMEEGEEMEEKLQQLKESMSKEKEERGHSRGYRWKSGKCCSLNTNALTNSTKKEKENRLQKLLAGKVKIRVLTDEPLTGHPQPPPSPPAPAVGLRTTRKNRLRGTCCGQCEVKTAGLMCAECTEDYCIGCFTKFHQKGALKFHKMIPIQADLQTHVSTQDVVSCLQKQINHSSHHSASTSLNPSPNSKPCPSQSIKSNTVSEQGDQSPEKGTGAVENPKQLHPGPSQVLVVNHEEEKKVKMIEERLTREDEGRFPSALLRGEFDERESARSFQEALRQWRGENINGAQEQMTSVSATATQADLALDRGADGLGRGVREGKVPVRVEFTENSLTYMDRLLLRKHRRTPIETYQSPAFGADLTSLPDAESEEEETSSGLTAQEEDFRHYCASLFAVPVGSTGTEPQITQPASYLVIEVLNEGDEDTHEDLIAEQKTDNNRKVYSVQQVVSQKRTLTPQTTLTNGGSSGVSISSSSPVQPSKHSSGPAPPKATQGLHLSKPQTLQKEPLVKSSSSKSRPSACISAETPRTSKTSIKTRTSASQKPRCLPTVHKSKPDCGSPPLVSSPSLPHSQTEIPKSSHAPVSFPLEVTPLTSAKPPVPEEQHLSPFLSKSFSLRSTFTVSLSGSTESTLLPKIYQSNPLQKGSDSSLLPEQQQSSQLFQAPISSPKLSQSPQSNLESSRQFQHSLNDLESLLSDNQLQLPLSPVTSSQNPSSESMKASTTIKSLSDSSISNDYPPEEYSRLKATPTTKDASLVMSSIPMSGDHESPLPLEDARCIPSYPSHLLDAIQSSPFAAKMKVEEELSMDSADEMSSDSLGLTPCEEESSDEEAQMQRWLTRGRSREDEQVNPALSHQEDYFVPADTGRENDLQTDEQEQLSEPSMVMHKQSAGSGSERLSDLDEFPPLGLDTNSGHSNIPEHSNCDSLHPSQPPPYDSDQTGLSSSLGFYADDHLVSGTMKDNQKQAAGIQIQSVTPSMEPENPTNDPKKNVSGSNLSGKFPPTLSLEPSACCLSRPTSSSKSGPLFRPLSRAALEIMEICSVDKTGCEDPDLDTDTTTNTLHKLEQELRLLTEERQVSVFGAGNSGSEDQCGNHHYTGGRVSQEEKDEEAAAQRDRQSVLLLP